MADNPIFTKPYPEDIQIQEKSKQLYPLHKPNLKTASGVFANWRSWKHPSNYKTRIKLENQPPSYNLHLRQQT